MRFGGVGGNVFAGMRRFARAQKNPRFKRGLKKLFLDFLVKRSAFERRIVLHLFNLLAVGLARVARSHIARRGCLLLRASVHSMITISLGINLPFLSDF